MMRRLMKMLREEMRNKACMYLMMTGVVSEDLGMSEDTLVAYTDWDSNTVREYARRSPLSTGTMKVNCPNREIVTTGRNKLRV